MVRDADYVLYCIRGDRCAFYHDENDRRKIAANGCKLNTNQEDSKMAKTGLKSHGITSSKDTKRFVPFSPHEDISADVGVYQRKHARSEFLSNQLPSLSQPVAIGLSNPVRPEMRTNQASYAMHHNVMMNNHPFMMPPPAYSLQTKISFPKRVSQKVKELSEIIEPIETANEMVYNNQLFEGASIPSRQTSYSEHSAYMFNKQYGGRPVYQVHPGPLGRVNNQPIKFTHNNSPQIDSLGVDSTTPSSEIVNKKRASKPESDHLKYLFDGGVGYERRADSLKSLAPPGLNLRSKIDEESEQAKSQNDFSEQYKEKLQSKFITRSQRKITEDKDQEDRSQNSSENESPPKSPSKLKLSKMCKSSTGFIPKHLRESQKKPSDDMSNQIQFDINKLVDSTVNSRKHSEVSNEDKPVAFAHQKHTGEIPSQDKEAGYFQGA
uniref:Uncharacterized protein n=1 Tax=Euplotes harpa TaxID=151035 RepID=A0A7S3NAI9_9SPIT|mmetsp:Transcript_40489/g.46452  ORF Transcript_40489/g.46452 Transcript_40489/m.46452 type:complete len:436 (+) Transcript_40489:1450-2757(+)